MSTDYKAQKESYARIKIDTREWVVGSRLWCYKIVCFEWQHDKTNKVVVRPAKTQISLGIRPVWSESVRPAKTQISLGIRPVWSESSLGALSVTKRPIDSSCGQRRLWSDWADDQTDLGFRWAHRSATNALGLMCFYSKFEKFFCFFFLLTRLKFIDVLKRLFCICNA